MVDVTEYKQPHEGVAGTDRSGDDLLSLDERALPARFALIAMARHLQTATLVGNQAPIVKEIYQRITNPRVGDLVVESSLGVWTTDPHRKVPAFGYLIEKRREWWHTDDEWSALLAEDPDAYGDDPRPTDEAWYVQYGPAPSTVYRWVNCSFLAVPIDPQEFR